MRKFWVVLLALSLAAAGAQAVAAAETPVKGGHLIIAVSDEPPGLDPTANTAAAIDRITWSNVIETLVKVDDTGKFVPGLAEKWTVSPDGKTYTFALRKNVKFHNGEAFDANVAKWNIERAAAKDTVNPHPEYFRVIEKIDAPDAATLVCVLKEPNALFIANMAEGDASMMPMKGHENAKTHPIGTGPFKFVQWVKGDRVELARFEGYWDPKLPYLDKVTYRFIPDASAQANALKAGDVTIIGWLQAPELAADLAKDKRFRVISGTSTAEVIISTNNKAKPFDNVKVRQAMAHALDRKAIIELANSGFGAPIGSHWSPNTPYYVDLTGMYPHDPAKAKALLAEAGLPNGFEAVVKVPDRYAYAKRVAEVAADQLAKVGIKLKLEMIEWGQWIERIFKNKEYQLTVIGHAEAWDINIYAKPTYYFQYDSKEFQDTYQKAIKAPNEAEQAKWFGECQKIVARDAVNGFVYSSPSLAVMKAEVQGWWRNYPTIALDCTQVWFKK